MRGFQKSRRLVDPDLLDEVRTLPCIACLMRPADPHHVTPVGAGGPDTAQNVMPLCRVHHTGPAGWHRDPGAFIRRFPSVRYWLEFAGREDILERYQLKGPAKREA